MIRLALLPLLPFSSSHCNHCLEKLNFNHVSLLGSLPTEIGLLSNLEVLGMQQLGDDLIAGDAGRTGLQGQLPSEIGQLESLGEWG